MGVLRKKLGRYTIVHIVLQRWSDIKTLPKGHDVGKSKNLFIYSTNMIWLCDVTRRGVMAAYTTTGNSKYSYF